jgi:hypothetical protein
MERRRARTRKDSTHKGKVRGRDIAAAAAAVTKAAVRAKGNRTALLRRMALP